MTVDRSWRSPDNRWLVDRVVGEPEVGYRIWCEGEPVGEVAGGRAALRAWLAARHVDVAQLVALAADEDRSASSAASPAALTIGQERVSG